MPRRRMLPRIGLAIAAFSLAVWANNSSWLHGDPSATGGSAGQGGRMTLLAHRGVHQTFSREGLTRDGCTATRIHPPSHELWKTP